MSDHMLYEVRDGAAWVTLNRPDDLNAMDQQIIDGYAKVIARAEADPDVKVVVFTGAGRAFSAGADLKYVLSFIGEGDVAKTREFMNGAYRAFDAVGRCSKPTIAAVNGVTAAGGVELLLACDIAIAARSAKIGDAHINFGLLPGGGGSILLPRKIGETRARYLLMTGELLPAETMADWGLLVDVVDDDQLIPEVEKIVSRMAAKSPLAMRHMKSLINNGLDMPRDRALQLEASFWEAYCQSNDVAEGLKAFSAKRTPTYTGT